MAGSAWTNQAVVSPIVVVAGTGRNVGIFVYDGTPGAGNLIGSWAPVAGVDPYGNAYPLGFSATQGTFSGVVTAGNISNTPIGTSTITGSDYQGGTMEETVITFDHSGGQIFVYSNTVTAQTFTSSTTWTAPAGVTMVKAECWAGGGGGGGTQLVTAAGGGGGGEYARENSVGVTPASMYTVTVGTGGAGGTPGSEFGSDGLNSVFAGDSLTVTANGGEGGKNSQHGTDGYGGPGGSGSTNSIHFSGGAGGHGFQQAPGGTGAGGGGGGSGGTSSSGKSGGNATSGHGGTGASAVTGGGSGGNGGNGANGSGGGAPGGGGGGSGSDDTNTRNGGAGHDGKIILTYTSGTALIGSWSATSGTDSFGNSYPEGLMVDAVNGPAVALNPTSGTAPETWHSLSLANSWGGTCLYRMVPDGSVQLQISIDSTSATAFQFGTMPTAYRPSSTMYIAAGSNGNVASGVGPFVQVTSAGAISMNGLHAFTTAGTWVCGGSYPLSD